MCFAGRGPGEVFVDERKAVGVTQWRVREGVFVSTVLHAGPTTDVLRYPREVPDGLDERSITRHFPRSIDGDRDDVDRRRCGDERSLATSATTSARLKRTRRHLIARLDPVTVVTHVDSKLAPICFDLHSSGVMVV